MITSNALGHFMYSRGRGELDAVGKNWALENAMRTIANAHVGSRKGTPRFCPATNLIAATPGEASPLKPTSELVKKSADHYEGFFHTDHLIPSVFFEAKPRKKPPPRHNNLTFRYIYDETADPDEHHELMTGAKASWYDVRRNMDRLPDFANPENDAAFTEKTRGRLANWLGQRLYARVT